MTMIGHYKLGEELGTGGMGTVYRGIDTRTETPVAIKQLKSEVATAETIERFRREGEALSDLNHPNIVKMLDTFQHEGQHYLVMEFVSGGDLKGMIDADDSLDIQQIVNMAIDLADALTRAHRLNIIHRDLKPANVLIGEDGVLRLTDFGVAHVGSQERVTDTDAIVGTIDYLPPEAFEGTFDARGDIWAFGVMLFEMLAGERPFTGGTLFETIQAITTKPIPDLEALCPSAPVALVDLVYRMLERDPQRRMSSVRYVSAQLEDILQGRDNQPITRRFETDSQAYTTPAKHNLPAETTPFVGREHELAELQRLVEDPNMRLITIVAQGGMGKTRLLLELGRHIVGSNHFADGVHFVELAPLSDIDSIPSAIADACGIKLMEQDTPQNQLIRKLSDQNLLLLLDNYEHLPEGFSFVSDILKGASDVQIVATSRQPLSQAGEALFHLSGMDFPDWETPEDAMDYAAVKLFMNSAKRANPAFELNADNLDYVARVCKLVAGMPLGIVLSASWLTILDISEIADELQGGIDFLETDETELPERQRSIRVVMDYSWGQMTESEQTVFMKLSVFRGGFTREATKAVADANLRVLMSLVKKSLIRRDANSGRYHIHELLREYADEKLRSSDNVYLQTKTIHAEHYIHQSAEALKSWQSEARLAELGFLMELDNLKTAWDWAVEIERGDLVVTAAYNIGALFYSQADFHTAERVYSKAIDKMLLNSNGNISTDVAVTLYSYHAFILSYLQHVDSTHPHVRRALDIFAELELAEQDFSIINAYLQLARAIRLGNPEIALGMFDTLAEVAPNIGLKIIALWQWAFTKINALGSTDGAYERIDYLLEQANEDVLGFGKVTYGLLLEALILDDRYEEALGIAQKMETDTAFVSQYNHTGHLISTTVVSLRLYHHLQARHYLNQVIPLLTNFGLVRHTFDVLLLSALYCIQTENPKLAGHIVGFVQSVIYDGVRKITIRLLAELDEALHKNLSIPEYELLTKQGADISFKDLVSNIQQYLED